MKFALIAATVAIASGSRIQLVQNATRNATGVFDESYDTHYDSLNSDIWAKAKASNQWQKDGVDQIKELNAWRGTGEGN